MKWTDRFWLWVAMLAVVALVWGCNETQQRQVWGQGDPPAAWQDMFGNENIARLNFVQSNVINRNQGVIFGIDTEGVDGKPVHKRGLIERVTKLEGLEERVRKLEEASVVDPNE